MLTKSDRNHHCDEGVALTQLTVGLGHDSPVSGEMRRAGIAVAAAISKLRTGLRRERVWTLSLSVTPK
jgi:hypothetical protein